LAIERRRREGDIFLIVLADKAAAFFDLVATDSVILLHQAPPFDHLLDAQPLIGLVAMTDFALAEAAQHGP